VLDYDEKSVPTAAPSADALLASDEQSFVPRSLASVDSTYRHRGASTIPPAASLDRERSII
jgi:hypothetical protein